jgi:competence protein CoiA
MVLYALSQENINDREACKGPSSPVSRDGCTFAADALPKAAYYCLECGNPVRLRKGRMRMAHFYHIRRTSKCSLFSKSGNHLLLQLQLQKFLPQNQTEIERPFPSIRRIGDLVWEKEKIVFEIQCSKISSAEAALRSADYGKIGYTVVWLLDDRIFNKSFVRPAEEFLRKNTLCYFFSFANKGLSHFYDQLELIANHKRKQKGFPLKTDLSKPQKLPNHAWSDKLPSQILARTEQTNLYFEGDLVHRALNPGPSIATLSAWKEKEDRLQTTKPVLHCLTALANQWIKNPYLKLLDRFL